MTTAEFRTLTPGTRVLWDEPRAIGIVRRADNGARKPAMWIEWEDGQRTEDYDDWALVHVCLH